jgi:hypothetical protein
MDDRGAGLWPMGLLSAGGKASLRRGTASIAWAGPWPAAGAVHQTGLQPDDIVGFLEPTAQLIIQIGAGLDPDIVPAPSRPVVDLLDDPGTVQPAMQREAGLEAALARGQTREPHPGHAHQPGLLGDHLDVAERVQHGDIRLGQLQDAGGRTGEQDLQPVLAAGVPQVATDQPDSALGTDPDRGQRW